MTKTEHTTMSNLPAIAGIVPAGATLTNLQRANIVENKAVPAEAGTHVFFDFNGERRYCWYQDLIRVLQMTDSRF